MNRIAASVGSFLAILLVAGIAFAQGGAETAAAAQGGMIALSAAIAVGLAAVGSATAQGRAAAAALDGIARNPQASGSIFVPLVLSLAFPETLTIFAFIIALQLAGNVG